MRKKILGVLLAGALAVGLVPTTVLAQTTTEEIDETTVHVILADEYKACETDEYGGTDNLRSQNLLSGVGTVGVGDYGFYEAEPNNSMSLADRIYNDYTVYGALSSSDLLDYYVFTLTTRSEVTVASAATKSSMLIGLLDSTGTVVAAGTDMGYSEGFYSDGLVVILDPGTYYVVPLDGSDYKSSITYGFHLGIIPQGPAYTTGEVLRVYGNTRYQTADRIIYKFMENQNIEKLDTVIIASGNSFADALAGSYLASVTNAPILLTHGGLNVEWFKAYVEDDATIYILGGTSAVPATVENTLYEYNIKRLAGASRYSTNLLILEEAISLGGNTDEILVCTGINFADSLSASATGKPILLVGDALTERQRAFITSLPQHPGGQDFYILGGVNAVKPSVESAVGQYGYVERIGGNTRYQTSTLIAKKFFDAPETAVIAYAMNFPDGLCGGPLAMSMDAPLILTATGSEKAATAYMELYGINDGVVLGGPSLISDASAKSIFKAAMLTTY